jgi:hypothetical protein
LWEEDILYLGEGIPPSPEYFRNWTFDTRGVTITFDEYQVAPYAAGTPSVLIPYWYLAPHIRAGAPLQALMWR